MANRINGRLKSLVREYFQQREMGKFVPGKTRIPLNIPSYGWEEVYEALESLLSTNVTMGKKVKQFEVMFADYIGVNYAIMTNSGSTANLLALSTLANPLIRNRIKSGDEVITPAVTWATTVFPIINIGAVPVLVDVNLQTFNIEPEQIKTAITDKTKAIMVVHLLGNPCDMTRIMELANEYNLLVIEDSCEAYGAELNGQKVGSFGDIATFSFFFTHHISTIEGGMVVINNEEYAELAKALRVFGWIRDLKNRNEISQRHKDIDPRYLFVNTGYNFRPTEVQGAFGIHQLKKLDKFIEIRRDNANFLTKELSRFSQNLWLHKEKRGTRHVWFGYPVTVNPDAPFTRKQLMDFLEGKGVETRPIMAGNIDEQPAMKLFHYRKVGELRNSRLIMRQSFFFGNHQGIGKEEREAIVEYFGQFLSGFQMRI